MSAPWGRPCFPQPCWSPRLQISQQPDVLEFPRCHLPQQLHFVGPLQQPPTNAPPDFPWSQLDGRPLVYASLGTLANRLVQVFRAILDGLASARSLQTVRAVDNPRCRRRCSIIASTPATSEKALPAVAGSISGTAVTAIP